MRSNSQQVKSQRKLFERKEIYQHALLKCSGWKQAINRNQAWNWRKTKIKIRVAESAIMVPRKKIRVISKHSKIHRKLFRKKKYISTLLKLTEPHNLSWRNRLKKLKGGSARLNVWKKLEWKPAFHPLAFKYRAAGKIIAGMHTVGSWLSAMIPLPGWTFSSSCLERPVTRKPSQKFLEVFKVQ
ncbi:hypothetical protein TNIN_27081 [Trichonephila inaurata madagascariensis]|uniref:Uncharacterized protein n=1 Tax=Trichonephila inaurata madagascariensis TaxID=2747483 RepID=A0A8X6XTR5_9ARAC|nr:hypothetical protein TNIN_27081 [Trichonephila inaurata madagascariensis]